MILCSMSMSQREENVGRPVLCFLVGMGGGVKVDGGIKTCLLVSRIILMMSIDRHVESRVLNY